MTRTQTMLVVLGAALTLLVALRGLWVLREERRALLDTVRRVHDADDAGRLHRLALRTRPGQWLAAQLRLGGVVLTVPRALLLLVAVELGCVVVLSRLLGEVFAVLGAVAVPVLLVAALRALRERRIHAMVDQLPDLATALAGAASAGLSLPAALRAAARDVPAPLGVELEDAVDRFTVGHGTVAVLAQLQERIPSRETRLLVTALGLQLRVGGNLVTTLRQLSTALEARRDVRREVLASTASVRTTSYLIAGLSFAVIAMLNLAQPGAVARTAEHPVGLVVLVGGTVALLAGVLLVRRTTAQEV